MLTNITIWRETLLQIFVYIPVTTNWRSYVRYLNFHFFSVGKTIVVLRAPFFLLKKYKFFLVVRSAFIYTMITLTSFVTRLHGIQNGFQTTFLRRLCAFLRGCTMRPWCEHYLWPLWLSNMVHITTAPRHTRSKNRRTRNPTVFLNEKTRSVKSEIETFSIVSYLCFVLHLVVYIVIDHVDKFSCQLAIIFYFW